MPCQDGGPSYGTRTEYRVPPEVKERLDRSTRLLCTLMKRMTDEEIRSESDEMQVWWAKHQLEDRKREAAEQAEKDRKNKAAQVKRAKTIRRNEALHKLTAEDKKALGL